VYFQSSFLLCRSSAIASLLKDLLNDDENDPARGASSRFDRWVGWRFQSFKINDFEMVDQAIASWNHVAGWLHRVEALRGAA
jgi:hypothetical protein